MAQAGNMWQIYGVGSCCIENMHLDAPSPSVYVWLNGYSLRLWQPGPDKTLPLGSAVMDSHVWWTELWNRLSTPGPWGCPVLTLVYIPSHLAWVFQNIHQTFFCPFTLLCYWYLTLDCSMPLPHNSLIGRTEIWSSKLLGWRKISRNVHGKRLF